VAKIKDYMKSGEKQRALLVLKKKKFIVKEMEKSDGAMLLLQQTMNGIESA